MLWRPTYHRRIAQLADGLSTATSFVLAYFIWNWIRVNTDLGVGPEIQISWNDLWKIIVLSVIWVVILAKLNAYTYQRFTSLSREFSQVLKTTVLGVLIFFAVFFLFRFQYVPRTYIIIFAVVNFGCLASEKILLFRMAKIIRKKGINRKKMLVVGTGNKALQFVKTVEENIGWGLDIIGFLSDYKYERNKDVGGKKVLGTFLDLDRILQQKIIDEVFICVSDKEIGKTKEILETCEREGVQVRFNSNFFGYLAKRVSIDYIYGLPIISYHTTPNDEWALYLKRLIDIFISGFLLLLLLPLFVLIASVIKLTSKGPVLYDWNVVGLDKKPFKSWKFRTMVQNAEQLKEKLMEDNEMEGPVFKMKDDPRITKLGRFLRKFSLDELPQLWSVLKGDMSLVGPRPAGPHELQRYESWQRRKLSIRPGITCIWQVKGRNKINDFDEWAKLDMQYIDNWSIWLDIKILLLTIPVVITGRGAS